VKILFRLIFEFLRLIISSKYDIILEDLVFLSNWLFSNTA